MKNKMLKTKKYVLLIKQNNKLMKKIAIILISFFLFAQQINAQNEIKAEIDSIQQMVNDDYYFWVHTVELKSMLAAIGLQSTQLTFYYCAWQSNPQYDPYEMEARLIMLEVKYNIAASVYYTQEYIFDEEEKLIYYMYKEEGAYNNESLYYYFDNEKLVQLEKQETDKEIQILDVDIKELEKASAIIEKAKSYSSVFKNLLDAEQLK
jgi:hypothetical protein